MIDVIFHGWYKDDLHTLVDVSYVFDLGWNLYSLYIVERIHVIISDTSGTHMIGIGLTFTTVHMFA